MSKGSKGSKGSQPFLLYKISVPFHRLRLNWVIQYDMEDVIDLVVIRWHRRWLSGAILGAFEPNRRYLVYRLILMRLSTKIITRMAAYELTI